MIHIERQFLLRLTLKSGRQLTEWVSSYEVGFTNSEITRLKRATIPGTLPEILRYDFGELAAVELVDRRRRLRLGWREQ